MEKKDVLIGWGRKEITPKGKVCLAGQFEKRVPTETYDPLYATAFAYKGGDDYIIWVSLDLLAVSSKIAEEVYLQLNKKIGLKREQLILSAIHTHTAPHFSSEIIGLRGETFRLINPEGCVKPKIM